MRDFENEFNELEQKLERVLEVIQNDPDVDNKITSAKLLCSLLEKGKVLKTAYLKTHPENSILQ